MPSIKVLCVDDQFDDVLKEWFDNSFANIRDIKIKGEIDEKKTIDRLSNELFDLLLLDIYFPVEGYMYKEEPRGFEVLKDVKAKFPQLPVIILSQSDKIEDSLHCLVDLNANYYISKERMTEDVSSFAKIIRKYVEDARELEYLRTEEAEKMKFEIVGTSPKMQKVFNLIEQVSQFDTTVLITGETGTGKELVAKAIHKNSDRKKKPFIPVNCGAIPRELMESELFGHERGAFTTAIRQRKGKFELANGGTIFLDEVGDLELSLQIKFLRVLQEQKFERVGGEQTIEVNVRVIAATNQNLNQKIKDGVFRSDLFFRLNVFPIHIPPLRERKNDIPLLVEHFRDKFNKKFKRNIEQIDEEVMRLLIEYDWPGNVRVLEGVIERAFVLAGNSNRLGSEHFHINLGSNQANENELESLLEPDVPLKESSKILEKMKIIKALERTNGSVTDAATLLGIDRAVVHRKMREHGIDRHIVLWGDI